MQSLKTIARRAGIALAVALPCAVLATPPEWAPAHGWRRQNDPAYPGYSGKAWEYDYGVHSGACDRDRIGQVLGGVLGGVAGGVIAGEVARGSPQREVAIAVGAVIGAAIGSEGGRRMDKTDRSCAGHALELAAYGQSVKWTNPNTRVTYQLTPLDAERGDDGCRRFRLIAHGSFGLSEGRTIACTDGTGVWQLEDPQVSRR